MRFRLLDPPPSTHQPKDDGSPSSPVSPGGLPHLRMDCGLWYLQSRTLHRQHALIQGMEIGPSATNEAPENWVSSRKKKPLQQSSGVGTEVRMDTTTALRTIVPSSDPLTVRL